MELANLASHCHFLIPRRKVANLVILSLKLLAEVDVIPDIAMPTIQVISINRVRSYILRLPLFTRAIILIITLFWLFSLPGVWDIQDWGSLIPNRLSVSAGSVLPHLTQNVMTIYAGADTNAGYRLSTFPLIHLNIVHATLNLVALTPLLERFENEYGTLTSLALFFGR